MPYIASMLLWDLESSGTWLYSDLMESATDLYLWLTPIMCMYMTSNTAYNVTELKYISNGGQQEDKNAPPRWISAQLLCTMLVMMVQSVPSQSDQTLHIISIYIVYHECNVIYSHILHIYLVQHRHVHSSPTHLHVLQSSTTHVSSLIFLRATVLPDSFTLALYTTPYVPSPIFSRRSNPSIRSSSIAMATDSQPCKRLTTMNALVDVQWRLEH